MIQINNLVKKYFLSENEIVILNNLTLTVNSGEIISVEGKSGIGKSTLLNIIGGLDSFESGELIVDGIAIEKLSEPEKEKYRRDIVGFIFQQHLLLPDFSALENVMIPLMIKGMDANSAKKKAIEILSKVNMFGQKDSFPSQLSGGESARVGVARALVAQKKIILADEPTGNLDRDNSKNLMELIIKLQKDLNFSMIIVTHDMNIAGYVHRRTQIAEGKITQIL